MIKRKKINKCWFVSATIKDLTEKGFLSELALYKKEIALLIKKYKPQAIIAERFMVRGRWLGATCEKINIMLGVLADLCLIHKIDLYLITSALWKNSFNRVYGKKTLNNLYQKSKKELKLPAHLIDSTLIGLYLGNKNFEDVNLSVLIKRIQRRCLNTAAPLPK